MKNVIITGASSGIGLACHDYFSKKGWNTITLDKQSGSTFQIDISSYKEIENFARNIKDIKIDALINNAAIQIEKTIANTTLEEWNQTLNTNLMPVFFMVQRLLPFFNQTASIVNISSVHAKATSKGLAAYVSSKGGVSALTRAMAIELAEKGIRANCILPGAIETPMLQQGLGRNLAPKQAMENLIAATPLKRVGNPNDIAKLAYFLAEAEYSSNITGQEFICDGGVLSRLASE